MRPALPWFLSPKSFRRFSPGTAALFGLPFLGVGLLCLWFLTLRPTLDWLRSRNWQATEAVIEKAWLQPSSRSNRTLEVNVRFHYQAQGKPRVGTCQSFLQGFSRVGAPDKQEIVDNLPAGKVVTCWVNPAAPDEAVLDRSLPTAQATLALLFATPFITIGLAAQSFLFLPLLRRRYLAQRRALLTRLVAAGRLPEWILHPLQTQVPQEKTKVALVIASDERIPETLFLVALTLVWNALVAVFVLVDLRTIMAGHWNTALVLTLFLTPFVAVGGLLLWMLAKTTTLLFRPTWVAGLRPVPDLAGGPVRFCWAWLGAGHTTPPQATVRIVARSGPWDQQAGAPYPTLRSGRGSFLSKILQGTAKREWELAATTVPQLDGATETQLTLPRVPRPAAPLEPAKSSLLSPPAGLGVWWELEITYRNGGVELSKLSVAKKLL